MDWIIHFDVNPEPKDYINRMGRTARLDKTGNSIVCLMKSELKLLETVYSKFKMEEFKASKTLLEFTNKINNKIKNEYKNSNDIILIQPQSYQDEVDENEEFRKKYWFAIYPIQNCIKEFLFIEKENLLAARKAFRSSLRSYVSFMRYQKDVFNLKTLNSTRFVYIKFIKFKLIF